MVFEGTIRQGDVGPAVEDVQRRLARLVDVQVTVDGVFDEETRRAVQAFQRGRRLEADGLVGPETWDALVEAGYRLGDRLLWHTRPMMRGDDVYELQQRLNQLGFDAGPEDGIFGPLAHDAVAEFQRNVGVNVDGVAGPVTVELLRRMERAHQTRGVGVRARERESLRWLSGRGLVGARIVVDPAHGPENPGHVGPSGATEAQVTWRLAARVAARLAARGAQSMLARGPSNQPTASERARVANELGADVVIGVAVNGLDNALARGSAAYYYGSQQSVSEAGYRLARLASEHMTAVGWLPDCGVHPMTWALLRETRMPAVVVEPGFLTSEADEKKLLDQTEQETLADALTDAVARFFTVAGGASAPAPAQRESVPG